MRCEFCQGTGWIKWVAFSYPLDVQCPHCLGGISHCCDGIQAHGESTDQGSALVRSEMDGKPLEIKTSAPRH
jgi:hypothetical protein